MRVLSGSTLDAYARIFWRRQADKADPNDRQALADISVGGDPVEWLRRSYSYKLPHAKNAVVNIVQIESSEELDALLVHDYIPCDDWMRDLDLIPQPYTRRLGQLARTALDRGYFASPRSDRPYLHFCAWRRAGSLIHAIDPEDRPLVETVELAGNREYEIVDGWGRLLPVAALLHQGLMFYAFEAFLASGDLDCPPMGNGIRNALAS